MATLTDSQRRALLVLADNPGRYIPARQVARGMFPDHPAWTSGQQRKQGALWRTAARVLGHLVALGYASEHWTDTIQHQWRITMAGREALA